MSSEPSETVRLLRAKQEQVAAERDAKTARDRAIADARAMFLAPIHRAIADIVADDDRASAVEGEAGPYQHDTATIVIKNRARTATERRIRVELLRVSDQTVPEVPQALVFAWSGTDYGSGWDNMRQNRHNAKPTTDRAYALDLFLTLVAEATA